MSSCVRACVVGLLGIVLAGCTEAPVPFGEESARVSTPSLASMPSTPDLERLATTRDCASCHTDVASHWATSAHARSSFDNPWYRTSVDAFRSARGNRASRFCAGCHDPLLLTTGGIDQEVSPEDDLAYAGITCTTCHSVEAATADGNGSYALTDRAILMPDPAVPQEIEAHRKRLTLTPLRTEALCGSCHRSFVGPAMGSPHHLAGIDDLGHWRNSAYGEGIPEHLVEVETQRCQDCHMGPVDAVLGDMASDEGTVRSHRWAASHTAMAAQLDEAALAGALDSLKRSAVVDVGAVQVGRKRYVLAEEAVVRGGARITLDVLMESAAVGHRFPGGTRDMHDTWLVVEVRDARGQVLGESRPDAEDRDGVHLLRSTLLDENGDPEELHHVHRFSTVAFDRTLPAHGTRVVRYTMVLPDAARGPLRVNVRLLHRKHSLAFQEFVCAASRRERGRRFNEGAASRGKTPLDPCLAQPVTLIAEATDWIGEAPADAERTGGAARPSRQRWLAQARGLLGETQERVALVEKSLARVLDDPNTAADVRARALLLRARMLARQGRADDALAATDRVEALVGESPVIDRVRGDALARVWRWQDAASAYEKVTAATPGSETGWRNLARAYGSLGEDDKALAAADAGLALAPRDESLLRSRALALRSLDHPDAELAESVWLRHRSPDASPSNLAACERKHVRCQTDRQPIPRYPLVSAPRKAIHAAT
ncbi:MAG: multiheme c-type cytochrome, partial [Myxococcota bacterium]